MLEFLCCCFYAGTSGPNVVEKDIGGAVVYFDFFIDGVSLAGLGNTGFAVCADLNGVFGTGKQFLNGVSAKTSEFFGNTESVV